MCTKGQDSQAVYDTLDSHIICRAAADTLMRTPFGKTDSRRSWRSGSGWYGHGCWGWGWRAAGGMRIERHKP